MKGLLKILVEAVTLSPVELQTALFEVADMSNKRGWDKILMQNCLLMGRSHSKVPDNTRLTEHLKKSE